METIETPMVCYALSDVQMGEAKLMTSRMKTLLADPEPEKAAVQQQIEEVKAFAKTITESAEKIKDPVDLQKPDTLAAFGQTEPEANPGSENKQNPAETKSKRQVKYGYDS